MLIHTSQSSQSSTNNSYTQTLMSRFSEVFFITAILETSTNFPGENLFHSPVMLPAYVLCSTEKRFLQRVFPWQISYNF